MNSEHSTPRPSRETPCGLQGSDAPIWSGKQGPVSYISAISVGVIMVGRGLWEFMHCDEQANRKFLHVCEMLLGPGAATWGIKEVAKPKAIEAMPPRTVTGHS